MEICCCDTVVHILTWGNALIIYRAMIYIINHFALRPYFSLPGKKDQKEGVNNRSVVFETKYFLLQWLYNIHVRI